MPEMKYCTHGHYAGPHWLGCDELIPEDEAYCDEHAPRHADEPDDEED
jgi:hypothetical protein